VKDAGHARLGGASLASPSSGALAGKGHSRRRSTPIPLTMKVVQNEHYRGMALLIKNTSFGCLQHKPEHTTTRACRP
jgi:hypothetical protein